MRPTFLIPLAVLATQAVAQSVPPRWAPAIDSMMRLEMAREKTVGAQIAIVERGRLVYTKGYGFADVEMNRRVTDRTLFQTGSLAKLFTGVLLAQLASARVVDVHAPISRYVPALTGRTVGTTTVHELLMHAAGWRNGANPYGRSDDDALGDVYRVVGDTLIVPGMRGIYSYSNPGFAMAGYVAERAAGRPYEVLLDSLVLRPLGMARSTHRPMLAMTNDFSLGYESPLQPVRAGGNVGADYAGPPMPVRPMPGNSAEWPAAFLFTSAAESARLAIAMMNDGMIDGKRVFAAEAIRAVTTGYAPRLSSPFDYAGYGMNTDSIGGVRVWYKGGLQPGYRALVTMWPARKLAVAVMVNHPSDVTFRVTARAAQIVGGITPVTAPVVVEREPTAAERAELIGTYIIARRTMEIHDTAGRLELRRIAYAVPIRMTGTDRFVVTPPGEKPSEFFVGRDSTGAVRYLKSGEQAYPRVRNQR